jgi:general secretion pathway protein C
MLNVQSVISFVSQRQKTINLIVVAVLAIYLISYAARLTWRIAPVPANTAIQQQGFTNNGSQASRSSSINLNSIKRLNLFGQLNQQAGPQAKQEDVTDAPETNLNLVLTGVVASSEDNAGAAVIENKGSQQTYGIGEKIEGTNATLKQVFNDRVIIRNGPRNETLMLDGIDFNEANSQRQNSLTTTQPIASSPAAKNRRQLSQEALEASQQLRNQPATFTDFISVSPVSRQGKLQGYRLQPGKNPALFKAAGLKAGDIITEINGLNVTDPQQASEALGELRSSEALQLTVLRKDEYLTLYLDLPEPGNDE